jgi:hypothetical protein
VHEHDPINDTNDLLVRGWCLRTCQCILISPFLSLSSPVLPPLLLHVEHKKTDLIFPTFPLLALTIFAQFNKARFYTHALYFR